MAFYLALDAGGTKTQCWVADETRVLAKGSAGTVKLMNVGEPVATDRLSALLADVLGEAGVDARAVKRTAVGLAGIGSESVRSWAQHVLSSAVGGELVLLGDEEIALDAAFEDGPGVLVIAGTGSNIAGRCTDGRMVGAGGWGPVIGDEGSGYWIGLEAIRAGLRAKDRGVDTCLLREIQACWKLRDLGELVAYANAAQRPAFGELTHVVVDCAASGDALATSVLRRAGEELAESVSLVASKMAALGCVSSEAKRVAFAGSVLGQIAAVRETFIERVHAAVAGSVVREEAIEPLEGALWKARRG
jgi:N-acetylglucosamine kinase-like BadF-type ATPase